MATSARIPIKPHVLKWARDTAGLDMATAAARVGVKQDRLEAFESGEAVPTLNQVRTLALAYHRPLAALFMAEPIPNEKLPALPDFRRPERLDSIIPASLQKAIMRAHRQRSALVEIAEDLDWPPESVNPTFALDKADPEKAGAELRRVLGLDATPPSVLSRPADFLRALTRAAEQLNVAVIQVQRVDVAQMRGFSLGDGPCPVIALNGADWPRGKAFSLLHELAHVGFRSNGLCDLEHRSEEALERACDRTAAAALMPRSAFLRKLNAFEGQALNAAMARQLGSEFGASGESATLRMVELGEASWDDYWRLKSEFDAAYVEYKAAEREENSGGDAPIFYQLKVRDLGRRFIHQVLEAYGENVLSSRDVAQLLEVGFDKLPKLARAAGEERTPSSLRSRN